MAKLMVGMKYAHTDLSKYGSNYSQERALGLYIQEPSPCVSILSFDEKVSGRVKYAHFDGCSAAAAMAEMSHTR